MTISSLHFDISDISFTQNLAVALGKLLSKGDVLLLRGDLGSGKTTFTKFLVGSWGGAEEISSPTFGLVNVYERGNQVNIWHYDLYRIRSLDEIYELGIEESLKLGITIVEWPEILDSIVFQEKTTISLAQDGNKREAVVTGKYLEELKQIMGLKHG